MRNIQANHFYVIYGSPHYGQVLELGTKDRLQGLQNTNYWLWITLWKCAFPPQSIRTVMDADINLDPGFWATNERARSLNVTFPSSLNLILSSFLLFQTYQLIVAWCNVLYVTFFSSKFMTNHKLHLYYILSCMHDIFKQLPKNVLFTIHAKSSFINI